MSTEKERKDAVWSLIAAENNFLRAFGWTRNNNMRWQPPPGYLSHKGIEPGTEHDRERGHAINSQKQAAFGLGGEYRGSEDREEE